MHRKKRIVALTIACAAATVLAFTPQAEARRGWRVRPAYRAPAARYYRPYAGRAYYGPRSYSTGYRGYGGVRVNAPGVGVYIGW